MDDIYNDLENYDDVGLVNELRSENSELKQKLAQCTSSMEMLQKDFDKLSADFKTLETNYSSLLKIAREEIKRKTTMITNLNIEKDMLVIKAAQSGPKNVQKLLRNVGTEGRQQNKKWKKKGGPEKDDFNRNDSKRPLSSDTSSTTDNMSKMLTKDRDLDNVKSVNRIPTKENENPKYEMFPDRRGHDNRSPAAVDRRLMAIARPPFSKLSSDEEFEDMYSALEPKTPTHREPERSLKRGRERSQEDKNYHTPISQDAPSNYPDPFRDRYVKNRTSRYSEGDRNMKRDKPYNENDRSMNRDKQYNENDRNMNRDIQYDESDRNFHRDKYDSHYRKFSPERQRRGAREFGDDRYLHQYDRHRRLESPPRERFQHRSRERRPFHEREDDARGPQRQDAYRYNHPDTRGFKHRIHGEYDEPQNKRPRIEPYSDHQEDRRHSDRQYHKEIPPIDVRERNCQSPDFSHTDNESSNDPIPEIRSTASTVIEDPRITSNKYVKTTVGDKEVLQTANKNKVDLQPVNKSLWNLQVVDVPLALRCNPLEISEELVDEMYVDKPASILSMESGEIGSITPDTLLDDLSDHREFNEDTGLRYKSDSTRISRSKTEKRKKKDRSPIDKAPKDISHERDAIQKKSKLGDHSLSKSEKGPKCKADQTLIKSSQDKEEKSKKSPTDMHIESTDKSSILHRLILSATAELEKAEILRKDNDAEQSAQDKKETNKTKDSAKTRSDNSEKSSVLHRLIHSVTNKPASVENNKADESCLSSKDKKEGRKNKATADTEKLCTTEILRVSKRLTDKSDNAINRKKDKDLAITSQNKKEERKSKGSTKIYCSNTEQPSISKLINSEKTDHRDKDDDDKVLAISAEGKQEEKNYMSAANENLENSGQSHKADCHKSDDALTIFSQNQKEINKVAVNKERDNTENVRQHFPVDQSEKMIDDSRVDETLTVTLTNIFDTNMSCNDSEIPNRPKQKTMEGEKHDSLDLLRTRKSEQEMESGVSIFQDFEHRVYSTRHIVEGDLELSDDTNDENQTKKDEKIDVKKKQKTKRKSNRETSKEKPIESEDTSVKTRSKKEKIKPQNKFSELFGDSSSLITPEELNLATREAHQIIADCCPPVCEDAQDGISQNLNPVQKPPVTIQNNTESKDKCSNSTNLGEKHKDKLTKDSKNRTHHKKHKAMDDLTSKDTQKSSKESSNKASQHKIDSVENQSVTEVKLVLPSEKLKEMQSAKITTDVNKSDLLLPTDKCKDVTKMSKKSKNKHEKKSPTSNSSVELNVKIPLGTNPNKTLGVSDNKENASYNDNLEKHVSGEMAKVFQDTVVSSKPMSVNISKVHEGKVQANEKVNETIPSSEAQGVINLAPVMEEPLVKTVVISTGTQLLDSNNAQHVSPLNALDTSTPAREISEANNSSGIEPKLNHTACVNVTIASEDSVSQSETDAPDMRIHCYRRRKKVLKR